MSWIWSGVPPSALIFFKVLAWGSRCQSKRQRNSRLLCWKNEGRATVLFGFHERKMDKVKKPATKIFSNEMGKAFLYHPKNNQIFSIVQHGRNSESKCQTKPWNVLAFSALWTYLNSIMNILMYIKPALYRSPFAWVQYLSFNWTENKLTVNLWAYALSPALRDKTNEQRGGKNPNRKI